MRNLHELDRYRKDLFGMKGDETCGRFTVYVENVPFHVVASIDGEWEHVSVTPRNKKRCPTWDEMCAIKDMFFYDEEEVIQIHPRKSEYVNLHPYCLHMWRPVDGLLKSPPPFHA